MRKREGDGREGDGREGKGREGGSIDCGAFNMRDIYTPINRRNRYKHTHTSYSSTKLDPLPHIPLPALLAPLLIPVPTTTATTTIPTELNPHLGIPHPRLQRLLLLRRRRRRQRFSSRRLGAVLLPLFLFLQGARRCRRLQAQHTGAKLGFPLRGLDAARVRKRLAVVPKAGGDFREVVVELAARVQVGDGFLVFGVGVVEPLEGLFAVFGRGHVAFAAREQEGGVGVLELGCELVLGAAFVEERLSVWVVAFEARFEQVLELRGLDLLHWIVPLEAGCFGEDDGVCAICFRGGEDGKIGKREILLISSCFAFSRRLSAFLLRLLSRRLTSLRTARRDVAAFWTFGGICVLRLLGTYSSRSRSVPERT